MSYTAKNHDVVSKPEENFHTSRDMQGSLKSSGPMQTALKALDGEAIRCVDGERVIRAKYVDDACYEITNRNRQAYNNA